MRREDLDVLLQEGEGTALEFEERLSPSVARDLAAMANTVGGTILLGVRDDGAVVGAPDSSALRFRIQDLARNCDPPVRVRAETVGRVVAVRVLESDSKPVQCADGFFRRQGAETRKLSRNEIRDFFLVEGSVPFDLAPCARFRYPEDFDPEKFDAWLRRSGLSARSGVEDVLVDIEAAERANGTLLFRNAGVLFFAKHVRRFHPDAYVTCLLARGTDRVRILDREVFDGGTVADIENAVRFVERNARAARSREGPRSETEPEYPMTAVREAIANAVTHRDWFLEGANVFVEIYSDRIEVASPGGLPRGVSLADLGRRSVRRNPLIADLLYRIGFVEKAGAGIQRIREGVRAQACPEPRFLSDAFFTAVLWPIPKTSGATESGRDPGDRGGRPERTTEVGVSRTTEVETESTPIVGPNGDTEEPVEDNREDNAEDAARLAAEIRLLRAIDGAMTRREIRNALGLRNDEHFRKAHLLPALEAGWIERTIPDKPTSRNQRYRVTVAGRSRLAQFRGRRRNVGS